MDRVYGGFITVMSRTVLWKLSPGDTILWPITQISKKIVAIINRYQLMTLYDSCRFSIETIETLL